MSEFVRPLLFGGLGTLVLALTFLDLFVTTLTVGGTGPITRRLPPLIWAMTRRLGRGRARSRAMAYTGMVTLLGISLVWIVLLWSGWLLVFSADSWSVVEATTGLPATPTERTYYVGYTLFTLGLGDYRPNGRVWQMLTVLVVGTGLTAVTLIISYIVPVISAAAQRRALAARLSTLGRTPQGILRRAWDGRDFRALSSHLQDLIGPLTEQAQQNQVYPVLSNFHPLDPRQSLTVRLTALDEALLLLCHAVPPDRRPPDGTLIAARESVDALVQTLGGTDPRPDLPPPAAPDPAFLRDFGLPAPPPEPWRHAIAADAERRSRLRALVETEGWTWDQVTSGDDGFTHNSSR